MSRSVSTPSRATHIAYAAFQCDEDDEPQYEFSYRINDAQEIIRERFPSMTLADRWLGNEDHVIAENDHACITVSEYNGLVAVCIVPNDTNLGHAWTNRIKPHFLGRVASCFGQRLVSQGRASNGEQFFQPADGQQRGDMGLGFTSKEGWL